MNYSLLITISGVIVGLLGIIFHLQGQSIVGPQSSFMYSNPAWKTYGIQIAIVGVIVSGFGIGIRFLSNIK